MSHQLAGEEFPQEGSVLVAKEVTHLLLAVVLPQLFNLLPPLPQFLEQGVLLLLDPHHAAQEAAESMKQGRRPALVNEGTPSLALLVVFPASFHLEDL
jgi:hypothetical protein